MEMYFCFWDFCQKRAEVGFFQFKFLQSPNFYYAEITGIPVLNGQQHTKLVNKSCKRITGSLYRCSLFHVNTGNFK